MAELDQRQERWKRAERIALDIIEECRVQLMLKFRFLDLALWRMPTESITTVGRYALATDGKKTYFEPYSVLNRFEGSFDELVRDNLHLIMHCIFRHPFDETHDHHEAWWLACDIVAESASMELCAGRFESELDRDRRTALSELRLRCPKLTPGGLYRLFVDALKGPESPAYNGISQSKMSELAALFERDNHEAWPSYAKGQAEEEPGEVQELAQEDANAADQMPENVEKDVTATGEQTGSDDEKRRAEAPDDGEARNADTEDEPQGSSEDADDIDEDAEKSEESSDADFRGQSSEKDTEEQVEDEKSQEERDWEEIAKQVEMNLDTFSKEWGDEAGAFIASLKVANRKRYDYSEFLRRFTMLSEEMKINDDEYDYIFYTYGIELYGNMPLVEPLEYKETQRIRDFVIAIDTSESCSGDLVKRFVEHTFDIIKRQEDFAHEVNIHVVQCDARVQADTKITDLRDVDVFMEGFYVRGMGGTDFRPVFAYVQDLRNRGELADMKGLIYFTDGLGQFPDAAPDYDTAFVFMDSGDQHMPAVPPWAMRVVIDEEGISRFKSRM